MMVSPTLALFAVLIDPLYLTNVLLWLVATRLLLSAWLWRKARVPDLSWPFILYFNQIINAGVKIYMLFHLARQRWFNRGGQKTRAARGTLERVRGAVAFLQLVTTVTAFVTVLGIYAGVLPPPF